jgi:hypothetical protein
MVGGAHVAIPALIEFVWAPKLAHVGESSRKQGRKSL